MLAHHGQVIVLRSPVSQLLDLQGTGQVLLAWEPDDHGAAEVEVRARIVGTSAGLGDIPIVRWSTVTSHGDSAWTEPQPALALVAGTPMLEYSLPARGMSWRVTSREFRIAFRNQGLITGAPLTQSTIHVSFLPGWGAFSPLYPYQHIALPVGGVQQPFPITAREWKLTDFVGLPLAPAAVGILFVGVMGALFGATDGAAFADFRPIPHDAAAFVAGSLVYASYR